MTVEARDPAQFSLGLIRDVLSPKSVPEPLDDASTLLSLGIDSLGLLGAVVACDTQLFGSATALEASPPNIDEIRTVADLQAYVAGRVAMRKQSSSSVASEVSHGCDG